jgi:hypothetical protein
VTFAVGIVVVAGLALAVAVGASGGLDAVALGMFGLMVIIGALGVAAARRATRGTVGPRPCTCCAGLNSPNAPFCKHCGAPQGHRSTAP